MRRRDLPDQDVSRYTVVLAVAAVRRSEVTRNVVREESSMGAPQSTPVGGVLPQAARSNAPRLLGAEAGR